MTEQKKKLSLKINPDVLAAKLAKASIIIPNKESVAKTVESPQKEKEVAKQTAKPKRQPPTKKKRIEPKMYKKVLQYMQKQYPNCFTVDPVPLAIGIRELLLTEKPEELTSKDIQGFLFVYTASRKYKEKVAKGGDRFGLDGTPQGAVSEGHIKDATEWLAKGKQK